jgi:hypothetical protein
MSDAVRPEEFAKYAPRWLREGTDKPGNTITLPSRRLTVVASDEPPWTKPSAFDGDVRSWRAPGSEVEVAAPRPVFMSARAHGSVVERLLWTAAITSVAVSAIGALVVVLFPSAPRDKLPTNGDSLRAAATLQSVAQTERQPNTNITLVSKSAVSDTPQTRPAPAATDALTKNAAAKSSEPKPPVETQTSAPQMTNAVYVAATAERSVSSQAQLPQQQSGPQPQTPAQPQIQVQHTQPMPPSVQPAPGQQQVSPHQVPDADEVGRLVARGEAFFAQGDVAAARVLLERAAEARDPRAALALGATYDPNVLKNMGVVGIKPDPEQAHIWYERAASYGSDEASKRLTALAQLAP